MAISADLGNHLEEVVKRLVKTGRYNSKSEVLREGVRLVEEREQRLVLEAALEQGLADMRTGRTEAADEVFERLKAKYTAMAASKRETMRVSFSRSAAGDLEAIGDFIATTNPNRAISFVEEINAAGIDLEKLPLGYPLVPGHEAADIRRRIHGNYLIFYMIERDVIAVLRILHGASDYGPLLP